MIQVWSRNQKFLANLTYFKTEYVYCLYTLSINNKIDNGIICREIFQTNLLSPPVMVFFPIETSDLLAGIQN